MKRKTPARHACFRGRTGRWDHPQAPQGLPVRDPREARPALRPRRQGAGREAGPQRSLSVRLDPEVQNSAACAAVVTTAPNGTAFHRDW